MPHLEATREIAVDADTLWRDVGSFQGVSWHPMLPRVEGRGETPGSIRRAIGRDGQEQTEKLLEVNPSERFYRYAIVTTSMPVRDYIGELRVTGHDDGTSTVAWMSNFTVDPKQERKAVSMVQGFLEAGVNAVGREYSPARPERSQ